jgi:hypothetical protein
MVKITKWRILTAAKLYEKALSGRRSAGGAFGATPDRPERRT